MVYTNERVQKGFTLIELMIAIAILGLIVAGAALVIPGVMERARKSNAESTLRALKQSIQLYNLDTGSYPSRLKDLVKRPAEERIARKWQKGGYFDRKEIPLDPWNNKYKYQVTPDQERPYQLYSYGSSKGKATPKVERMSVWDL